MTICFRGSMAKTTFAGELFMLLLAGCGGHAAGEPGDPVRSDATACTQLEGTGLPVGFRRLNVRDAPYSAAGDGVTDDTTALQRALDDAAHMPMPSPEHYTVPSDSGHGGVVFIPAGNYLIASHLTIPPSVTLMGEFGGPPNASWSPSPSGATGAVLLSTANPGMPNATPFISLSAGATLEGVSIFYPEQTETNPPIAYPWTVRTTGLQASMIHVALINPFRGVDIASNFAARFYLRGIYGQPLDQGIAVDHSLDIGRIEDVHFTPIWRGDPASPTLAYQRASAIAITFLRSDWQIMTDIELRGYATGVRFAASPSPCAIAGACGRTNGQFTNLTIDADIGLDIVETANTGLHVSGYNYSTTGASGRYRIPVWQRASSTPNFVTISRAVFEGPIEQAAAWDSPGCLSLVDTTIGAWNPAKPAIAVHVGQVVVQRTTFAPGNSVAIAMTGNGRGTATGNTLAGNRITGTVAAAGNTP